MSQQNVRRRPAAMRRGWMFVPGMNPVAQEAAIKSGADVVVADLEEFTAPSDRPMARVRITALMAQCHASGVIGAVRVNKLDDDGRADLLGVMPGRPDVIFLPHVETPQQIVDLDKEITALEALHGIPAGFTEIVPTIESASGLLALSTILHASPRIKACLLAAEDFANSLGAERGPDNIELLYARQRFLLECTAARRVAIDCPCTFRARSAFDADLQLARRLGYKAKCVVFPEHVQALNQAFTPTDTQAKAANQLIKEYEIQRNNPNVDLATWIDAPLYNNARRLLDRHTAFLQFTSMAMGQPK